jgi:hypothetical protein
VDDNVRVAFTATRTLPAGSTLDATLYGTGVCDGSIAVKTIRGPKNAGQRFRVRFRPADQVFSSAVEWCQGKAKLRLTEAKSGSFVRMLGERIIRFRAKP